MGGQGRRTAGEIKRRKELAVEKPSGRENGAAGHAGKPVGRPLGDFAAKVLEPVIARRAGMTLDLIAGWEELAGPRHAAYTRPERIVWPRRAHEDDPFAPGTLIVACEGARAIWLQHEAGEIVERVNVFFGFQAICRLKIVQRPVARLDRPAPKEPPSLDAAGRKHLEEMLAGVGEGPLRERLMKLGAGIIARERRKAAGRR